VAIKKIIVFYAWQSDRPQNINRHFVRNALDAAAKRITEDPSIGAEVIIDADTEGVVGTPPVTETILRKIAAADVFVPDLTFVARTESDKLIPNPNVMIEYGYALRALTSEAMMPVMNTYFGAPESLPFDLGHVRHPTRYELAPSTTDATRRTMRDKLSVTLEGILRLMVKNVQNKARSDHALVPHTSARGSAFFFQQQDVLANFGDPGEQELRFKRILEVANTLMPLSRVLNPLRARNDWGVISLQPHGSEGITSFTQIFETGELWGVSEEPFTRGIPTHLAAIEVEKMFIAPLENFRMIYERELKLRPPFTIEFGATGLKGHSLTVPSTMDPSKGERTEPIRKDNLSYKAVLSSFDRIEWQSALREFFVHFYDLAARDRSKVLTDRIVEANELPPR
jgi:hypothetical protein